jgi:hypothetical protein
MTDDEIGELLAVAAGYDQRTVGRVDIDAWQLAFDDPRIPNLQLGECVDAVILHYRDSPERIMPAHILTRVKAERAGAISKALPAGKPTPGAYAHIGPMWRKAYAETSARMKRQKDAVLAHPDLAERLTMSPLNYAKPEQWNGGVPAETFNGGNNDSPRRAALAAIVEEAIQRTITGKDHDA